MRPCITGEYEYGGTLDAALARAKKVVHKGGAMTLMLVMPPPPKGLAAVRVVAGVTGSGILDTSEVGQCRFKPMLARTEQATVGVYDLMSVC